MKHLLPLTSVTLSALLAVPVPVLAWEGDTFRPFVSLGHFYDSNLFRLAESEYALVPQRSEQYNILSGGLNVDWKPGRQQVLLNATKNIIRYDRFSYLDFNGEDLQATWNWRVGNHWTGNLGATKSTSQSSFNDIGLVNNQMGRERRFGRAEWEFHPRWRIGGGVERLDGTNSAPSQASQDFSQQTQDVVLSYYTPKGSTLRGQVRRIDAKFPNAQCLVGFFPVCSDVADNSFKQTEYNLSGDWRLSGKVTLRAQAGWTDRQYENNPRDYSNFFVPALKERPDFSGFTGRISADWFTTGKTLLSAAAYQEPGGASDINASSVLRKGASLNGVWLVREKWRLNAGATYESRDFKGDPGVTSLQRQDNTSSLTLSVSYMPIQAVSLDAGVSAGRRNSNFSAEDYKFHTIYANVRGDF